MGPPQWLGIRPKQRHRSRCLRPSLFPAGCSGYQWSLPPSAHGPATSLPSLQLLSPFSLSPGCTPLHWASIRGNLEAVQLLVQAGAVEGLLATDSTGATAAQLASDKGHRHVALFLVGQHTGWVGKVFLPCLFQWLSENGFNLSRCFLE